MVVEAVEDSPGNVIVKRKIGYCLLLCPNKFRTTQDYHREYSPTSRLLASEDNSG